MKISIAFHDISIFIISFCKQGFLQKLNWFEACSVSQSGEANCKKQRKMDEKVGSHEGPGVGGVAEISRFDNSIDRVDNTGAGSMKS